MSRVAILLLIASAALPAAPDSDALFQQARNAQVQGRLLEAEKLYRDYLKRFRPTAEVMANLGALLARQEQYQEAIGLYRQALQLEPALAPLHLNLGLAYLKSANAAEAVGEFDAFLKAQPGHRQTLQLRAMALLELERYAEAERQYRELMAGGDVTVALGLSTALLRQGKIAEARSVLEPNLAQSDSAESLLVQGQLLLQEQRYDDALATLEKARSLNPAAPGLSLAIGSVLWRQRKTAEALREWRSEYQKHPDNFEILYTLGAALSLDGSSQVEAEKLLRRATALRPQHPRGNYQLARLVWQRAKDPEALVFLERATKNDTEFREAFFLQATVLQSLGRAAEARKLFARVKDLSAKELARQQDLFSESP